MLLFLGLVLFIYRLISQQRDSFEIAPKIEQLIEISELSTKQGLIKFLVSLLFLIASTKLLFWSVIQITQNLDVSELVIGLRIIAVGTSLPELMVSIA